MNYFCSRSFFYFKPIIAVFIFVTLLASCVSIPDFPSVPKDIDPSKMAQIKLISLNPKGFNSKFGGVDFQLHYFLIPILKDKACISFNKDYMVKIEGRWETSDDKFFDRRFKFNDNAVFNIPMGNYEVCVHKLLKNSVFKSCFKRKFLFEQGQKYEVYISYKSGDKSYYIVDLEIFKIKRVDEFKTTQMFYE